MKYVSGIAPHTRYCGSERSFVFWIIKGARPDTISQLWCLYFRKISLYSSCFARRLLLELLNWSAKWCINKWSENERKIERKYGSRNNMIWRLFKCEMSFLYRENAVNKIESWRIENLICIDLRNPFCCLFSAVYFPTTLYFIKIYHERRIK